MDWEKWILAGLFVIVAVILIGANIAVVCYCNKAGGTSEQPGIMAQCHLK